MKNASKATLLLVGRRQDDPRDRHQHLVELGLLVVLQHHPLAALLPDHALVVGQVVGRGLHAAIGVAGREHGVDHRDRRHGAQLRVAERRVDGQVVLDVLQCGRELLQLGGLGLVLDRDEGLERRLVVEPLVLVDLVGPDRRFDRRGQLHPLHVAGVVVVRDERVGARLEEGLERRARRWPLAASRRCMAAIASSPWYSML